MSNAKKVRRVDQVPDDVWRHLCGFCVGSLRELFALYLVSKRFHSTLSRPMMLWHFEVSLASHFELPNLGPLSSGLRAVQFEMSDGLKTLPVTLTSLNLSGSNVDQDELFAILPTLVNLTALDVSGCYFAENLGPIPTLPLRTLKIGGSDIDDWSPLGTMHTLRTLDLTSHDYLSMCDTVDALIQLPALHTLVLDDVGIDELLLRDLTPIAKTLKNLSLNYTKLTDESLQDLPRFKHLETLSLRGCSQLTRKCMQCIAKLDKLRTLCLRDCGELGIHPLMVLSRLSWLDISHTTISDPKDVRDLQERIPNLRIVSGA